MTLNNFVTDPNMTWFRDHIGDARGLFIVPQYLKGAFFFGAAGGSGILVRGMKRPAYGASQPFLRWGPAASDSNSERKPQR